MKYILRNIISGLKSKQWVRLKRGLYKDDIAQVDYFDMAQNQVHLKLLPRIDYTRLRGALRTAQSVSADLTHCQIKNLQNLHRSPRQKNVRRSVVLPANPSIQRLSERLGAR